MAKILIVDDTPDIAHNAKLLLERGGYEVLVCESVDGCFKLLTEENPDLVLLDVMLPNNLGWDVCKKIKDDQETKHIPVVMFTVHAGENDKKKSFEYAKADGHICKPFKKDMVIATIEEVLEKSKKVTEM